MRRNFSPPPRYIAGFGTRTRLDNGAHRAILCKRGRYFRRGLRMPKLGPSSERCPKMGFNIIRTKGRILITFSEDTLFLAADGVFEEDFYY